MEILVVEHEERARVTLHSELTRLAFVEKVTSASSEQIAEQRLSLGMPDIVLLDMQLPDSGAFRFANRSWAGGVPIIICVTTFDRKLLDAFRRHRVEYLVRPFSTEELTYVITRGRRSNPIDPIENLGHLLDVAFFLQYPVRGRIRASLHARQAILEAVDIAAIRYDRGRFYLWTDGGIFESSQPLDEIARALDLSGFCPSSRKAWISRDQQRFGRNLSRARRWLRWRALLDLIPHRRPGPLTDGTKPLSDSGRHPARFR
jgi:DNA-binding LytR/AlgR family response regulator